MALNLLLTLQPDGHLAEFILVVGRTIGILGEIDVKAFRELCVVVVSGAKEFNGSPIVVKRMQLRKRPGFTYAKDYEDLLVGVKGRKSIV